MTDPIQHLRELMAKAKSASEKYSAARQANEDLYARPPESVTLAEADAASELSGNLGIEAEDANHCLDQALRNLAPKLLEVVEAAQRVEAHAHTCAFMEDRNARCDCGVPELWKALAALGGESATNNESR